MLAAAAVALLWPGAPAQAQQCATTGTNQTCSNSIFLSGGGIGIQDNATLTVTNTNAGTIFGTGIGIFTVGGANVTNYGAITTGAGGIGIAASTFANVSNYGSISGGGIGIFASTIANVSNYGTISASSAGGGIGIAASTVNVTNYGIISGSGPGGGIGIVGNNTANVINYGTISGFGPGGGIGIAARTFNVINYGAIVGNDPVGGGIGIFATGTGASSVTNAGTIFGSTFAIQFGSSADTLTLLPGSRIIGAIDLGGGANIVNFGGGNHNLTFVSLAGTTVTSTTPFVVVGNRAVAFDATGFAMADRTLNDIAGGISGMIANRFGPFADGTPGGGGGMVASYAPVYKAPPVAKGVPWPVKAKPVELYDPAIVVWAQGFGGVRNQPEALPMLASRHNFAGAAIGFDRMVSPYLRLGAFAGGAWGKLGTDFTVQNIESDYAFGGLYGRYDWRRSFLDFAVSVGRSRNESERIINNNLVPNGTELAKASYNGWFVSPEATYGWRLPLTRWTAPATPYVPDVALVPSAKVRYLAAWFDGYTETGTTAPLTGNDRTLQTFEGRLQLALATTTALPWGNVLRVDLHGGAIGYTRVGDKTVSALLLGQGLAFPVPGKDQVSGWYYGSGFDLNVTRAVRLFAEGEGIELSDKSRILTGRGGIKAAF